MAGRVENRVMTTYYVGPGGNDGNTGLSWAQRFLTLNGAEDEPVASGDTVYVGPSIYRETLTCDVDGASEIAYIADVTGENTDGVGGAVIISGSDNDTTATRSRCIEASVKSYRTFIGFHLVGYSATGVYFDGCDNVVMRDFSVGGGDGTSTFGIYLTNTYNTVEITRCYFLGQTASPGGGIQITNGSDQAATSFTISDCLFVGSTSSIYSSNVDSVVIQNCTSIGAAFGYRANSLAGSTSITVRNCITVGDYGMYASAAGEIASTYCQVTATNNNNWTAGTGDVEDYVMNLQLPILYGTYAGIRFPPPFVGEFNPYAYAARRTGSSETSTDLFGITKPTTASKSSWGAVQYVPTERETTTTRGASAASIKLADAGEHQIWVPVTAESTTVAVYCYREANHAGTNPRMVIKEPGQSDRTTTDAAAASQWNELTDTFTPSGDTDYVVVCLQSLNTATSGSYAVYFDDLSVS